MLSVTEPSSLRYDRTHVIRSTASTVPAPIKHPHDNSAASIARADPLRLPYSPSSFQKFSTTLLKNKGLLVPRRLALKRQRPFVKPSSIKLEPLCSDTLQMELGNPDEFLLHDDHEDEELNAMIVKNMHFMSEHTGTQSTSHHTTPVGCDTPHTVPTDISLLYREKPLFSHPVTGHFIVQYAEENGGPSPCSYVLPRKSCREKNAPAFTFGSRCLVEKKGGSRTGWQKQWFAHSNPYTTKVDFHRENVWPTPFHYPARPTLGIQPTKVSFPAWSIGTRLPNNTSISPEDNPGPDTYNAASAFQKLTATNTHITLKSRPGGTQLSTLPTTGRIPGPGAHDEKKFLSNKYSAPKHSFGRRMPTSLAQDPYVHTLPSIGT